MKLDTNSNSDTLASLLADSRKGTFTGLITRKVGKVVRGVRYNDDMVHTVIFTGFKYENLVRRSLDLLASCLTDQEVIDLAATKGTPVAKADVQAARAELESSFRRTLMGESTSTTDHVYEPLKVADEDVRGGRVYKCVAADGKTCHCRNCTGNEKAPLPGTIYLQGLRIWSEIVDAAPNGKAPAPNSRPKTIAKNILRARLPVSKYVSYRLEPGTDFVLRAGGTVALEATKSGMTVDPVVADAVANVL